MNGSKLLSTVQYCRAQTYLFLGSVSVLPSYLITAFWIFLQLKLPEAPSGGSRHYRRSSLVLEGSDQNSSYIYLSRTPFLSLSTKIIITTSTCTKTYRFHANMHLDGSDSPCASFIWSQHAHRFHTQFIMHHMHCTSINGTSHRVSGACALDCHSLLRWWHYSVTFRFTL